MPTDLQTSTAGILNPRLGEAKFQISRYEPSPQLQDYVEYYWHIEWNLRPEEPHTQQVLSHPAVHIAIEPAGSYLYGVVKRTFIRQISERGEVFGIRFSPAGFYPFAQQSLEKLTSVVEECDSYFGPAASELEANIRATPLHQAKIAAAEAFLCARLQAEDPQIRTLNQIVYNIQANRQLIRVEQVAEDVGLHPRTLQRLFRQYIGVSPKWVIQRYRLHEAAEQLLASKITDWASFALDLGYFDQAHFIKDFKQLIGQTPLEYMRTLER